MKRIVVRLTESELRSMINNSVKRVLMREHKLDIDRDVRIAQKELFMMGKNLSSVGLRLDGTRYYNLYRKMVDSMIQLNDALIKELRKEG